MILGRRLAAILGAALVAGSFAAGCAGPRWRPPATAQSPGERLYYDNCGACHDMIPPFAYTDIEWGGVLRRMVPETGLSNQETQLVLHWLRESN